VHGLEASEPFDVVAKFSTVDECFESKDILDEVHDLVEIPLEGSCDVFKHEKSPSLGCQGDLLNPLDHSHASPLCSQPSPSLEYYIDVPSGNRMICGAVMDLGHENMFSMLVWNVDDYVFLGCFRGYDPFIGTYCVCLEDLPKKVMLTIFFNPSYDFSEAFDKIRRILMVIGVIFGCCLLPCIF